MFSRNSAAETRRFFSDEMREWMPRGGKRFGIAPELLEAGLDDAHLVGLVVDREVRAVAEAVGLAPQDAAAGGVERHHPHAARLPDELLDALAHLASRRDS